MLFFGGIVLLLRGGAYRLFLSGAEGISTARKGWCDPFIILDCCRHSVPSLRRLCDPLILIVSRRLSPSPLAPFPRRRKVRSCSGRTASVHPSLHSRPPLTSLPCSSFSAKRHAKVACSVVNALTTALLCYHLFAVLRAVARFLWGFALRPP